MREDYGGQRGCREIGMSAYCKAMSIQIEKVAFNGVKPAYIKRKKQKIQLCEYLSMVFDEDAILMM